MVRLIMGANGAGKTKQLIDLIHNAVEAENGSVVCMEPSADMTFSWTTCARSPAPATCWRWRIS